MCAAKIRDHYAVDFLHTITDMPRPTNFAPAMSDLYIYNSLSRSKEKFEPVTPGHVGLYVCGPTVNGESHLGHARPYVTFDVVLRWLRHLGYKVRYVRNITDAGHFEENDRTDNDRIGEKARLEKLEPMELVHKYTSLFHRLMAAFNNLEPSIEPTATGHIVEQIAMIQKIMADGYAYEVNGSVYFDVKKYAESHDYGKLSGRKIDELLENTRDLEGQDEKRNKVDFALWKAAPPQHIQRWQSPWGEGFPGWHIECSAMASKYLGTTFDIHGGGMDLQFPHHESEIAQSTIAHGGHAPVRYWMHNNMITINGRKMGRSYNNIIKLTELFSGEHELLEQAYNPMTVRFNILQTHYRSTLDFSNPALQASEKALQRLWEAYEAIDSLMPSTQSSDGEAGKKVIDTCADFTEFMNDDFSTAKVIAGLFDLVPIINGHKAGLIPEGLSATSIELLKMHFKTFLEDILGLQSPQESQAGGHLDKVMDVLIDMRRAARARKDFATSDAIRNQLTEAGIVLKDEKDGSVSWTLASA